MSRQDEYEAAYFTLLRAREQAEHLNRYGQILEAERLRLVQWMATLREEMGSQIPAAIRRPIDANVGMVVEALEHRLELVIDEERQLPKQIEAQLAFILECVAEVDQLKP